jgi:hypothetical protein
MSAATAPIKRPPRRPSGSAGAYTRTTITLATPVMRVVIRNAKRRNKTISGYIEEIVAGHADVRDKLTPPPGD